MLKFCLNCFCKMHITDKVNLTYVEFRDYWLVIRGSGNIGMSHLLSVLFKCKERFKNKIRVLASAAHTLKLE